MKFVDRHERVLADVTELDIVFHHIEGKEQSLEQIFDIVWVPAARVLLLVTKGDLHVKGLPICHVCIAISENPEVLHRFDVWTNSLLEIVLRETLIGYKVVHLEVLFSTRHHHRSIDGFYPISSLSDLNLNPEILEQFFKLVSWIP